MSTGWVKLWRKGFESEAAADPELWMLWTWILVCASHREHTINIRGHNVYLEPGQFYYGRGTWARRLPLSEKQIRRRIGILRDLGMIRVVNEFNRCTIMEVVNWSAYQGSDSERFHRGPAKTSDTGEQTPEQGPGPASGPANGPARRPAKTSDTGEQTPESGPAKGPASGPASGPTEQEGKKGRSTEPEGERLHPDGSKQPQVVDTCPSSEQQPEMPESNQEQVDRLLAQIHNENVRKLVEKTIERIHLIRKCGRAQPSVIARFLRGLFQYENWKIGTGLAIYLEGDYYLDHKGERYCLGIVRNVTANDYRRIVQAMPERQGDAVPAEQGGPQPSTWPQFEAAERRGIAEWLRNKRGEQDGGQGND